MSIQVSQVTYTKCAPTRRGARVWIEGAKLGQAGFDRYAPYTKLTTADSIVLSLGELSTTDGTLTQGLKVAGRTRNGKDVPIIDLSAASIEPFNVGDSLRVVFSTGRIVISKHHEQQSKEMREKSMREAVKSGNVTEASLFTGAGVSTMAIHDALGQAGLKSEVKFVVDQELKYLQVGCTNNYAITDDTTVIVGDIAEIEPCWYQQVNVLSFSMPCAGFGRAGRVKHGQDSIEHSGTSLFGVINAIKTSNPAVIISENVREARVSPMYELLKAELRRTGYVVSEQILDSSHTDSLENRPRYWMVAISEGLVCDFELNVALAVQSGRKISDILESGPHTDLWSENTGLKAKALRDIAKLESGERKGTNFKRQLLTGDETRLGTIGRFYNKKRSTEPFLVKGKMERLLTPVEHARVKSVPESLIKGVSKTKAHEVLGQSIDYLQAVAVTLATIFAIQEAIAV